MIVRQLNEIVVDINGIREVIPFFQFSYLLDETKLVIYNANEISFIVPNPNDELKAELYKSINIKGQKGEQGKAGKDGKDGLDGKDGKDGKNGTNGVNGANGKDGKDGINGTNGERGQKGDNGTNGIDGRDGSNGKDGIDGAKGEAGTNGKDGDKGDKGEAGKDGVDGRDGVDGQDGLGLNYKDEYLTINTYDKQDIVKFQGNLFIAIKDVPTDEPPAKGVDLNDEFWRLFLRHGRDGRNGKDATGGEGGLVPHNLNYHTDVTITNPLRNQMLRYNNVTGKWENKSRYNTQKIVQSLADLPTPIGAEIFLENLIYVIDADLDITGYTLVFGTKTQINGLAQNVSTIRSSTSGIIGNPYIFFKSTTNLFMNDLEIVCEGTNQCVWNHIGDGTVAEGESFELNRFNLLSFPAGGPPLWGHNNQLGIIKDIRQGFIGTFSCFGFENGFKCAGAWTGGFRIDNTLFRVFKGIAFGSDPLDPVSFAARMSSNANLQIPLGSIGYDFPETAFAFTGQYQLQQGNVSGDGVYVSDFTSGFPAFDPLANFQGNTGIQNTFQGGEWIVSVDTNTTFLAANTWYPLELVTTNKFLTWFSELDGIFTYDGGNPLDITILMTLSMTGKANDIVQVKLVKESALMVQTDVLIRQITISGTTAQGRAESVPIQSTEQLVLGDKIRVYVRNTSGTSTVTTLLNSNCIIGAK